VGLASLTRARRARLVPIAVGVVAVLLLSACLTEEEKHAAGMLTGAREKAGVQVLQPHEEVQAKAHAWAQHMADSGQISHSTLSDGISAPWQALGETVSSAGSIEDAFDAQMRSSNHRHTITDGRFTHAGVGVARSADGTFYLAIVFMQL